MEQKLLWIRYFLILIALLGTIFLEEVGSYKIYTFLSLLYIALDQLLHRKLDEGKQALLLVLQLCFITFLNHSYMGMMFVLYYSTLLSFFRQTRSVWQVLYTLIQWIVMNVMLLHETQQVLILANLMYGVMVASIFLMRNIFLQREEIQHLYDSLRKKHYELEEARGRLLEHSRKVENWAQLEERNRISKSIHDDIGHQLIRCKMMMEAVIQVLPTNQEKGMELIYQVRDHLSASMDILRKTVRQLKPNERQMRNISLKQWMDSFALESGVEVDFQIEGEPYTLFPSMEVVLYRNVQEAFSNAIRHGQATKIEVRLIYDTEGVQLIIRNNGSPPSEGFEKGLGIKGMEERVELIGGECLVESRNPFTIKTVLPYKRKVDVS
ncbi:sensor histidine kinase [Caldalkalibacillus mannanilyticus]|uniref:sensor histidine kinase n=1 Tax=Caldalkalibacillus mannanilyticus TaxID=1418 RepID=UPI00046A9566|nr:sensor histidine kinase [Caldalkalibacillus mannanilyticus]